MEKTNMEDKMEQILKDEKEKLLFEIREAVLNKKSMMVDPNKIYYKKRRF
jgi:hypothetical protein